MMHLKIRGIICYDGAVLSIGDDPRTYFLKYGNYKYGKNSCNGWYLQVMGKNISIPIADKLLEKAEVIDPGTQIQLSTPSENDCCMHESCHQRSPETFTSQDKYYLDRTWIAVNTISERDSIPKKRLTNGRVVQVNYNEHGEQAYYRYNEKKGRWDKVEFLTKIPKKYVTKKELDAKGYLQATPDGTTVFVDEDQVLHANVSGDMEEATEDIDFSNYFSLKEETLDGVD